MVDYGVGTSVAISINRAPYLITSFIIRNKHRLTVILNAVKNPLLILLPLVLPLAKGD
jgi:hypothetical protein